MQLIHKTMRAHGNRVVRALIGPALIGLLVYFAEPAQVWDQLKNANKWWLVAAVMLGVAGEFGTSVKWSILFRQIQGRLPVWQAFRISLIGMFYNNFLPSSVGGDIVRSVLASPYVGGISRAAAGAFMQRNTGFAGLLLVVIPSVVFLPLTIYDSLWKIGIPHILAAVAMGFLAANIILMSERCYHFVWGILHGMDIHSEAAWWKRLIRRGIGILQKFHAEVQGFRILDPVPLGLSVLTQLTDCLLVWTLAQATGLDIPWQIFLFLAPLGTLGALVPVSINGLGIRELVYTIVLLQFSARADGSVAVALLHTGVILLLSAVGALLQAHWMGVASRKMPADPQYTKAK